MTSPDICGLMLLQMSAIMKDQALFLLPGAYHEQFTPQHSFPQIKKPTAYAVGQDCTG